MKSEDSDSEELDSELDSELEDSLGESGSSRCDFFPSFLRVTPRKLLGAIWASGRDSSGLVFLGTRTKGVLDAR